MKDKEKYEYEINIYCSKEDYENLNVLEIWFIYQVFRKLYIYNMKKIL